MILSKEGEAHVVQEEGERLTAYRDTVGIWTIGIGHTGRTTPPPVSSGMKITVEQSRQYFRNDIKPVEALINRVVLVPITQSMYDALVSFTFNVGGGAFSSSTLLKKLNAKDYNGAANEFLRWVKQPELRGRRERERALFLEDGMPGAEAEAPSTEEPVTAPTGWTREAYWIDLKRADHTLAAMQERLSWLHYETGPVDGIWGPITAAALSQFLARAGLPAMTEEIEGGRIDDKIMAKLFAVKAPLNS
jgi:lysozyme